MFEIERYKIKGDAYYTAKEMIRAQGAETCLGSGAYGRVYGSNKSDVVYKMGDASDNEGYLAFIKTLSKQKTHNPYLPRIYGVRFIKDSKGNEYFVVAMERLQSLPSKYYRVAKLMDDMITEDNKDRNDAEVEKIVGIKRSVPKELTQAIRVLRAAYNSNKRNLDWDLHSGNFMLRGRQVVVTDPLC